jgi:uncharacterized protein (DUF2147 family)
MFRRFQGIDDQKLNRRLRYIVMQNKALSRCLPGFKTTLAAGALICATAAAAFAAGPPKEAGLWIDDSGDGAVKIEPCGAKLCGHIVWLRNLVNDKGDVLKDRHNPDPKMQSRLICGLPVIGQLDPQPGGGFDGGWVYDPKEGKSYSVAIQLAGADQLQVTGYLGVKLLGKTLMWTRAKTELPSCATNAAAAPADTKNGAGAAGAGTAAAVVPSAAKVKKAGSAEALPWADAKPAAAKPAVAKPAAAPAKAVEPSSKLGATGVRPQVQNSKKTKQPAAVIQRRPETAVSQ